MTTPTDDDRMTPPTAREIAALTARLRSLSAAGADADDAEREAFLADKHALLARITAQDAVHRHEPILGQPGPVHDGEEVEWHPLGSARLDLPAPTGAVEEEAARRDQLTDWHYTDHAVAEADGDYPEITQEAP